MHAFNDHILLMYYTQNKKKSINLIISVFLCNDLITRQQSYMARSPQPAARNLQPATRSPQNSQFDYCVGDRKKKIPKLSPFALWPSGMIYPQWLELPISRTNFHGPKDFRAVGVRLYLWETLEIKIRRLVTSRVIRI